MVELKKPQIKWTEDKKKYLIENYPYSDKKKMCIELGCTYKALKSMARNLEVKSLVDKNFYKLKKLIDDNEYNNYWWGYILADGHINERNQLSVIIKRNDSQHLEKLSNYLGVKLKCRKIKTHYTNGEYCNFTCQDAKYGETLKKILGISKNKTYNCISFDWINTKEKFLSVFAGFYDGDGCLEKNKKGTPIAMKIECHYNWIKFLEFCSIKLKEYYNIESVTYITTRGSSAMRIYKCENIMLLFSECKKYELPLLERKWI